jgi:asparagine N-glycosylation enzyme membrane subunit Stt3
MGYNLEIIKRLARFKIYVDRARWYLVLIQFFIIVLIYTEQKGLELSWFHYPFIILGVMVVLVVVGFLDRLSGMIKEEQRFYSNENPIIKEILDKVNKKNE